MTPMTKDRQKTQEVPLLSDAPFAAGEVVWKKSTNDGSLRKVDAELHVIVRCYRKEGVSSGWAVDFRKVGSVYVSNGWTAQWFHPTQRQEADRAKLLELVRQATAQLDRVTNAAGRMLVWANTNDEVTAREELSMTADDEECRIAMNEANAFLSRCKEVVPDLLVDGGDNPLPPSPTEP